VEIKSGREAPREDPPRRGGPAVASSYQGRKLAFGLGLTGDSVGKFVKFCAGLYTAYVETDAALAEINPLVKLKNGRHRRARLEDDLR